MPSNGPKNDVHPTAIIDPQVVLGARNIIGPYCVIYGPARIGNDNRIGPGSVLGTNGIDTRTRQTVGGAGFVMGDRNNIADQVSLKQGYKVPTILGNGAHVSSHCSIGHDAELNDGVLLLPGVVISGTSILQQGSVIGSNGCVRPRVVIGAFSTLAQNTVARESIPPLALKAEGRALRTNTYNLSPGDPLIPLISSVPYENINWRAPGLNDLMEAFREADARLKQADQ